LAVKIKGTGCAQIGRMHRRPETNARTGRVPLNAWRSARAYGPEVIDLRQAVACVRALGGQAGAGLARGMLQCGVGAGYNPYAGHLPLVRMGSTMLLMIDN
jgi:hypothetical protein